MITRNDIFNYLKKQYNSSPEFLWRKYPNYAVFKHDSGKWFAAVMNVTPQLLNLSGENDVDIIDLKIDPELGSILKQKDGYYPGYHMNKENWIAVLLNADTDFDELKKLINDSYLATDK